MREAWSVLGEWVISGALMALVGIAWARSYRRARVQATAPGTLRLRYPVMVLVIALVCFLFFTFLLLGASVWWRNETSEWWVFAILGALSLMGLWMLLAYFVERFEMTVDGLRHRSELGRRSELRWDDVQRIVWSDGMKWFRLTGRDGTVVRASGGLVGLAELAQVILARAPQARMDEKTRLVLEDAAAGRLPPIL